MSDDLGKEMQTLKKDVEKLRDDVTETVKSLKALGRDKASQARSTVEQELGRAVDEVRGRSQRAVAVMEHEIDERPMTVLLAAFAVGFVLGKLLDRS